MRVLILGGSRNIGYYVAQRLLKDGDTVTFLLRNKACFDSDETIKPYIASGKARITGGDALKEGDIQTAWNIASEGDDGGLDTVIFTIGFNGTPKFTSKGLAIDPPDLCTRALLNLLAVFPRSSTEQPKLVVVSSTGISTSSYAGLPLHLKLLYGYVLHNVFADKLGVERVVHHATGMEWPATEGEPPSMVLRDGWKEENDAGWLTRTNVVIVRAAKFTNGRCRGDEKNKGEAPFRAEDMELKNACTISRKDVAFFIVQMLQDWETWGGKCPRIAY